MEDNLARELQLDIDSEAQATQVESQYELPLEQEPRQEGPSIGEIPQSAPVSKGLTKLEIGLIIVMSTIFFAMILFGVYSDLQLTKASRSVQDVNVQIEQTESEIENLKQHTQELTRYDRISEIAEKYGLELHEENIKNLTPVE